MRIAIISGDESTMNLQLQQKNFNNAIFKCIESLRRVESKINELPSGGAKRLQTAIDCINSSIKVEQIRTDENNQIIEKVNYFLNRAVTTDQNVMSSIFHNQEIFFKSHEWLRPPKPKNEFESWLDQRIENWNKFWGSVGEALSAVWNGICNFVKKHWVEIVVGLVAITVGAALMAITGGGAAAFLPLLLGGLKATALSAVAGGAYGSALALFMGADPLKAFGDGFASGFMIGGVTYCLSCVINVINNANTFRQAAKLNDTRSVAKRKWWESEKTVSKEYSNYKTQVSYKDGKPVKYGTKNSVRPDNMKEGFFKNKSLEVKNYKIETQEGKKRLSDIVIRQYNTRLHNLPKGTKQNIIIDIKGHSVTSSDLKSIYKSIMKGTRNGVNIKFLYE